MEPPAPNVTRRLAAPLALAAVAVLVLWFLPSPCPIRFFLGVPCPSCGLTRAARAAAHLDFHAATQFHPLWFVVFPALALCAAIEMGSYVWRGRTAGLDRNPVVQRVFTAILAALVVLWIARFFGAFGGPVDV